MLGLRQLDWLGLLLASHKAINLVKSADTITVALFVRQICFVLEHIENLG